MLPIEDINTELNKISFVKHDSLKQRFLQKIRKPFQLLEYKQTCESRVIQIKEGLKINEEQRFKCKICQDYYIKFTITSCGHTFCYLCIFEHLLKKHKCPICSAVLKGLQFVYCKAIDQILLSQMMKLDDVKKNAFLNRKKELKEWKLKKQINNLKIGDEIDVLDTEHIWCVGKIMGIKKKKENQILVHYQGWNKVYDEYISSNSPRLSRLGLFTNRNDILLYQPSANEETMSNFVRLVGQQNQEAQQMNYVIYQQHSSQQSMIVAFEQTASTSISNILQLVLYLRQLQSEPEDEELDN